jgi:hypothetical protein
MAHSGRAQLRTPMMGHCRRLTRRVRAPAQGHDCRARNEKPSLSYSVLERLPTSHYRLPPITDLQIVSGKVIYRTVVFLVPQKNHNQASPSSCTLLSSPPLTASRSNSRISANKNGRQSRGPGPRPSLVSVCTRRCAQQETMPGIQHSRMVAARPFLPASIIHEPT